MKRLLALCCALALAMPASAQTPAPAAAPIDPALAQSVRELLTAMKYREQLAARLQQTAEAMPQTVLNLQADRINANPKLTAEQKKAELAIASRDSARMIEAGQNLLRDPKLAEDIVERIVPVYARQFTLAETRELTAFYKSPTAGKMQALLPQIAQEANGLVQETLKERLATIVPVNPKRK